MILVNKKENLVLIELNKKFYRIEVIKKALEDFGKVCNGEIKENEKIKIKLIPKEKDILDILGYEFCNYVLGLMKEN